MAPARVVAPTPTPALLTARSRSSRSISEPRREREPVWRGANAGLPRGHTKEVGAVFETRALEFLQRQRLRFVARNVTCRGGEIDLVMRDRDDTLVFVEVRARMARHYGGAAGSVSAEKRRRLILAAQFYLASQATRGSQRMPACRFDVIAFEAGRLVWLRDAFRADDI
jgi:putative endonuclease